MRDRASYAFALVSVAAALELAEDGTVADVRIAWGGAAHKPWRASVAEDLLRGRVPDEAAVRAAAESELAAAEVDEQTAYKPAMVRNATVAAFLRLAQDRARHDDSEQGGAR